MGNQGRTRDWYRDDMKKRFFEQIAHACGRLQLHDSVKKLANLYFACIRDQNLPIPAGPPVTLT